MANDCIVLISQEVVVISHDLVVSVWCSSFVCGQVLRDGSGTCMKLKSLRWHLVYSSGTTIELDSFYTLQALIKKRSA